MDYATLRCTLMVNPLCDACKMHMREILSSTVGKYDVTMDGVRQTVTMVGEVDPNYCMKVLARCNNGHAKLLWANLSHPRMGERSYAYDYDTSSYYDGIPYGSRRSLPPMPGMYHDYPALPPIPQYSYNNGFDLDYYGHNPIYRRSNPTIPYDPHQDYSSSFCTIM